VASKTEWERRALSYVAFDYMTKPIDMVCLLQTVQTAIGSSITWLFEQPVA
jgi:hypothetical protein